MTQYIYKVIKVNNDIYIGRTKNPTQRKAQHKYNMPNSIFRVLCQVDSKVEAKEVEQHLIDNCKCINRGSARLG